MDVITATYNSIFKGAGFLVAGILVFSIQDAITKMFSGSYPIHEIVLIRSLVALGPILIIAHFEGGLKSLRTKRLGAHILRSCIMFGAYTSFFMALAALQLAEVITIFLASPLFITIMSAQFLNEKVDLGSWIVVIIGFTGVVIMLKPGANIFDPAALLALLAGFAYAVVAILTRRLGTTENGAAMAFYPTIVYICFASLIGLLFREGLVPAESHPSLQFLLHEWRSPSPQDASLLLIIGLLTAMGYYSLSQAYRLAQPAAIAPFEYISTPLGILWGFVFWRDIPELQSMVGMVLIVGSGLFILGRKAFSGRRHVLSVFRIRFRR